MYMHTYNIGENDAPDGHLDDFDSTSTFDDDVGINDLKYMRQSAIHGGSKN